MIRETAIRSDASHKKTRIDRPGILLPSPHFDPCQDNAIWHFFESVNARLNDRNTTHEEIGLTIRHVYGVLQQRRQNTTQENWISFVAKFRSSPLFQTFQLDAFTQRAYSKPRGYAGDAKLLDLMYGAEHFWTPPEMSWVGQRIHRWTIMSAACEGVRSRREVIAEQIDEMARTRHEPEILSLAAGHFREAELSKAVIRGKLGRAIAIDSDARSMESVSQDYHRYGVQTVHASARELISGRVNVEGKFDLIYSSGLCDYLNESICQRLTENLFNKLKPGGRLLLTNFVDQVEQVGYMEAVMDWHLIYRDRFEMLGMSARVPESEIQSAMSFTDETNNIIFLQLERAA